LSLATSGASARQERTDEARSFQVRAERAKPPSGAELQIEKLCSFGPVL